MVLNRPSPASNKPPPVMSRTHAVTSFESNRSKDEKPYLVHRSKMNISMRLAPHHMGIFRHDKGCRQQSPRTTMRLAPHLAYFLITSKRRGNIRSYRRQRCGSHRILCAQQVGLTPQCK
ncbi:hypothetical protein Hanom_Chr12g01180431 [Helianthus anomalus]